MIVENQMVEVKWNNSNKAYYISKGYVFSSNGDIFRVDIKDLSKGSKVLVRAKCDYCGEEFTREMERLNRKNLSHHFCNADCQHKLRAKNASKRCLIKNCEECKNEYKTETYRYETSRFCSQLCLSRWQSKAFKGEGSANYVERFNINCDWCNSKLKRTANKIKNQDHHFCDRECQQNWHRHTFVKTDEFLEMSRKTMLNNLSEGKIKFTETEPHKKINAVLEELSVKYVNEKIVSDYAIDIYLPEYDLYIEVNGEYWHCDNRKYKEINFTHQLDRIIKDKRKKTYLLKKNKINILYLWESDINNNIDTCLNIIALFIKNKGILNNYHSMNYFMEGEVLVLTTDTLIPYMDRTFNEISSIVNLEVRKKVTGYDDSKHVTFECEYCSTEKTQALSTFMSAKNHFCSVKCKNLSQQVGNDTDILKFDYSCTHCDKNVQIPNYIHQKIIKGTQKNVFCSKSCNLSWQSENLSGKNNSRYNRVKAYCLHCEKEDLIPPSRVARYKYCSDTCKRNSRKNKIKLNCNYCDFEIERTPSQYKKSKNHFCSNKCADKFKSEKCKEDRTCKICGTTFTTRKADNKWLCSITCQGKWQSIYLVGANANNYKGKIKK